VLKSTKTLILIWFARFSPRVSIITGLYRSVVDVKIQQTLQAKKKTGFY
jgi:hypothetical protein